MSHRIDQINSLIKRELGQIILEELDVPQGCFITITKVETTKDLSQAKIWISILPESRREELLQLLEKNIDHFNHLLARKLVMKKMPHFIIKIDISEEKASRIEELIDKVKKGE